MPDEGFGPHSRSETPFQGLGARGTNNLASKLLLALLPPNAPFFRYQIDQRQLMEEGADETFISETEVALQKMEKSIMDEIAQENYRVVLHEALKHLIVTGNALLFIPETGGMRSFRLDRYVVERDPMGNVVKVAVKESIAYDHLPESVKSQVSAESKKDKVCDLYTAMCKEGDKWRTFQDVNGILIPEVGGLTANPPFLPLRFSRVDGESYGRGYVEEYLGDLQSLEALTKAIVEGSAVSAKCLFLVNPNGTTRAKALAESPNGAIVNGVAGDVTSLQVQKSADLSVAMQAIAPIKERLAHSFLISSAQVRNAERVTAEEIRMLSQELETALGGLYSLLATEMQLPMVKALENNMSKQNKLPKLPKDLVKPVIVTGIEALGRGNDLQRLDSFIAGAAQIVGPDAIMQTLNVSEYFKRRATALGIDTLSLLKSPEQMQAEQQQAQQMAMMEKLGPNAINAGSRLVSAQEQQEQQ
tara:strand:- start:3800 stop:5221 length:1422 start_codon:yes stop_codon:yes gene_type:complete